MRAIKILKNIRSALNLTQQDLADALGVSRDVVANWENGRVRIPADMLIAAQELLP